MLAEHDVAPRAEEQERARAVRALGLALPEALVPDERRLLVARKARDLDTLEDGALELAVHFGRGDDLREDGRLELEELEQGRVPLERVEVHEERAGRVRDIGNVQPVSVRGEALQAGLGTSSGGEALGTHVEDPGFNGAEHEVVLVVRLPDVLVVVNHPPELDSGEVRRDRKTRTAGRDQCLTQRRCLGEQKDPRR